VGIAPGWYSDPADPTIQRWWDGEGWVGAPIPAGTTPPAEAPPAETPRALDAAEVPPSVPTPPPRQVPPGWSYHPRSRPGPAPKPHGYPLATLGARVVARVVDIIAVFLLNAAVNGWFVVQYVEEVWPMLSEGWRRSLAGETSMEDLPQPGEQAGTLQLVILLLAAALWFAYEVPAVANSGQTLGKRLLRIKVVRLDNAVQPLGFGRSIRRWNPMGIGFLAWSCFCLGLALNLVDFVYALYDRPLQQTLHDKYAQTVVVALVPESANPRGARSARPPQAPSSVPESVPSEEEQSDEPADPRRS
jgi:uncharacterized RDD family membrane protein YckC